MLAASLADKNPPARRGKSKQKERSARDREILDVDSSSDDDRRRDRSRSVRRRSRSRSPTRRGGYNEYNWIMLGQFWPVDQRPAIPYQGIIAL